MCKCACVCEHWCESAYVLNERVNACRCVLLCVSACVRTCVYTKAMCDVRARRTGCCRRGLLSVWLGGGDGCRVGGRETLS